MRHSRGPMPYATRGENRSQSAHNTARQRDAYRVHPPQRTAGARGLGGAA